MPLFPRLGYFSLIVSFRSRLAFFQAFVPRRAACVPRISRCRCVHLVFGNFSPAQLLILRYVNSTASSPPPGPSSPRAPFCFSNPGPFLSGSSPPTSFPPGAGTTPTEAVFGRTVGQFSTCFLVCRDTFGGVFPPGPKDILPFILRGRLPCIPVNVEAGLRPG